MNSSQISTILSVFLACCVLCSFGYEKKSDFSEFASAINGAGRLRYGKRSGAETVPDFYEYRHLQEPQDSDSVAGYEQLYPYVKRAPMATNQLIQSLNGAERLRFGRK